MREYRWHTLARWVAVVFLAAASVAASALHYVTTLWPLLAVCGFVALYNRFFSLNAALLQNRKIMTRTSLVLDIISLTVYLHFSGDIENPLMFAYSLPVVAGAVIVSKRDGFWMAGLASMLFGTLLLMTILDSIPVHLPHHHLDLMPGITIHESIDPDLNSQGWNYIVTHVLVLVAVLFASAHGFGTLSQRIREKEAEVLRENERMELLLSILPEGVVLATETGSLITTNPAARAMVPELRQAPSLALLPPPFDVPLDFSGPLSEFETSAGNRTIGHVMLRAAGNRIVWVFRDLTEQHKQMAQTMHQSKMMDLGLLAAGLAHEIGNPLSSMSAIIQMIEMRQAPPEILERLKSLGSHVHRISGIVHDITNFARPSAGRRMRSTPSELVDKALQIFRFHEKSNGMRIDVTAPEPAAMVDVVEDQIVQVLLNLLLNAADASGKSGTIGVECGSSEREATISVIDRGAGMSAEVRRNLFTPFFTTKDPGKGVGLGLSVSESIMRSHGGRIEVRSSPGAGSTFVLCLPRVPEVKP